MAVDRATLNFGATTTGAAFSITDAGADGADGDYRDHQQRYVDGRFEPPWFKVSRRQAPERRLVSVGIQSVGTLPIPAATISVVSTGP